MSGFAQVFILEMRLRKAVFPAALVAGLVPIPLALLMCNAASFSESLNVGAFAFALIGGELLALYLGATVLCQDLSEGRQGFFFSRPISGWALWAGKFSAAWLVVLGAMFVTLLPATLLGEGLVNLELLDNPAGTTSLGARFLSPLWTLAFVAVAILLFMALAHALSVMFRARSPWLILDAVMVVLLPALAWWGFRRVMAENLQFMLLIALFVWGGSLLFILLPAGALQTALGRCDLRRGHKVLSITLWGTASAAVLLVTGYIVWATSIAPSGLKSISYIRPAPEGPWVIVGGPGRGLGPYADATFLLNSQSGAWARLSLNMWGGVPLFSPDGKTAVFFRRPMSESEPGEVVSFDLTAAGDPEPVHHGILFPGWSPDLTFSPDSSKLAILHDLSLDVYDLPSWKLAAVRKLDLKNAGDLVFAGDDLIRIYQGSAGPQGSKPGVETLSIFEWDLGKKTFDATGKTDDVMGWSLRISPDRTRMLLVQAGAQSSRLLLCDARTGAVLKVLWQAAAISKAGGAFLQDGRIVVIERKGDERTLRVFTAAGDEQHTVQWSPGTDRGVGFGPEPLPGKVLLSSYVRRSEWIKTNEMHLWDVDTGAITLLPGLHATWSGWWSWYNRDIAASPGSQGADLFLNDKGQLVRYDFATGQQTPIKLK